MANNEAAKPGRPKNKKGNVFVRMGKWIARWFKEMVSELKKVTWPTFAEALKKTGVVLLVVFLFLIVLMGFDQLLKLLYDLLVRGLGMGATSSAVSGAGSLFSLFKGGALWL
ncbi:MAG: preprotein translocase subunit SecE [Clostridiales bacterium]|jgi:preprotein translocase subunit SecE|nr:preprotein translocase subunit SecE [Clostridiales bacterium]